MNDAIASTALGHAYDERDRAQQERDIARASLRRLVGDTQEAIRLLREIGDRGNLDPTMWRAVSAFLKQPVAIAMLDRVDEDISEADITLAIEGPDWGEPGDGICRNPQHMPLYHAERESCIGWGKVEQRPVGLMSREDDEG